MAYVRGKIQILALQRQLDEFRWNEIKTFIEASRDGMKASWDKFSERFDKATEGYTEEQIADYVDHVYDDMSMLRDGAPVLMRHSHCMIVYGAFEHALAEICRAVHRDGVITTPSPQKIYMDEAKGYLRPLIGDTPFGTEWDWLHTFRIIRNWMAHAGGKAQPDTNPDGNWAKGQAFVASNVGLIRFEQHREIFVEDGLITLAINHAIEALDKIGKAAAADYP